MFFCWLVDNPMKIPKDGNLIGFHGNGWKCDMNQYESTVVNIVIIMGSWWELLTLLILYGIQMELCDFDGIYLNQRWWLEWGRWEYGSMVLWNRTIWIDLLIIENIMGMGMNDCNLWDIPSERPFFILRVIYYLWTKIEMLSMNGISHIQLP